MKNALVIEDEQLIALDIKNKLSKQGYFVDILIDYDEIMECIRTKSIDIILADIDIPGDRDGIDVVNEIKRYTKSPVIYLTAYDEDEIIERAKASSPYAYLIKPFDEKELFITISIALDRHRLEQQLRLKEQWITSIVNNITDGILVTDLDGNVTFANKVVEDLLDFKFDSGAKQSLNHKNLFSLLDKCAQKGKHVYIYLDPNLYNLPINALLTKPSKQLKNKQGKL